MRVSEQREDTVQMNKRLKEIGRQTERVVEKEREHVRQKKRQRESQSCQYVL